MLEIILPFCIFACLSMAFTISFCLVKNKTGSTPLTLLLKTIGSIMFVFGGIYILSINGSILNMFIVFGLVLAMIGDIILEVKYIKPENKKFYFNFGLGSFLISALTYAAATIIMWHTLDKFLILVLASVLLAVGFAVVILLLEKPMKYNFTGYKVPLFCYSVALSFAVFLTLGVSLFVNGFFLLFAGVMLVLLSDLVLSIMYFKDQEYNKVLNIINHVVYYAGEIMVMAYLFFQLI